MRLSLLPSLLLSFLLFLLLQMPTFATKKASISFLYSLLGSAFTWPRAYFTLFLVSSCGIHNQVSFTLHSNEKAKDAMFYSYNKNINGFAAILEEEEAAEIASEESTSCFHSLSFSHFCHNKHNCICFSKQSIQMFISVFLNKGRKLHTTRSWHFLDLERMESFNRIQFGRKPGLVKIQLSETLTQSFSESISLCYGVWPESKSFSDEGMGLVPPKWRGHVRMKPKMLLLATDDGDRQNQHKISFSCAWKLIGARYFNKGYAAYAGPLNSSFNSARDHEGHGSHTLSTAGGGSPGARVAAYKVCWPQVNNGGCFDADIMAAFDAAIHDGVDVLSVSLGGDASDYFTDGLAIGSFHAVKRGIVVVSSAGNDGPKGCVGIKRITLDDNGWCSTIDREFTNYVALGNRKHLKGMSLSTKGLPSNKFYPVISSLDAKAANASAQDAILCKPGTLNPKKVKGKILSGNELIADPHVLPASHVNFSDGAAVFNYINSTNNSLSLLNPMAYLTRVRTQLGIKPASIYGLFFIEGTQHHYTRNSQGVNIIAAYSESIGPTDQTFDKRRIPFNAQSGTSMSCPHISGIVGLLKTLHPDWSPAAIKSAIMTSARTRDDNMEPMLNSSNLKATPFSYGAGHVRPNRAMDPGLKPYKCPKSFSLTGFNYPSITVPNLSVAVKPNKLEFREYGEEKSFRLTMKAKGLGWLRTCFRTIDMSDGQHYVRSLLLSWPKESA
ncbi:Subtilisin-like protease SBT5.4 [Vitis vinifera]|uniref:Subtilisin-like protease SBT5.4 n=1 Tax=Vitis vinifera TaxID=29760 RepID=A0A438K0J9_VITVI|nr:Subtilisin-like protease SBT5.4 [Vitis vinifera]